MSRLNRVPDIPGLGFETEPNEQPNEAEALLEAFKAYQEGNQGIREQEELVRAAKEALGATLDLSPSLEEAHNGESKNRRTNILVRPTAHDAMKDLAAIQGTSFNNLINVIMDNVISENAETLEAYRAFRSKIK